jgi:hypothetical protein
MKKHSGKLAYLDRPHRTMPLIVASSLKGLDSTSAHYNLASENLTLTPMYLVPYSSSCFRVCRLPLRLRLCTRAAT